MTAQAITPELRAWIQEQLEAGCRTEDVLQSMQASGWERAVALSALHSVLASLDTAAQSEDGLPRIALEGAVNRLVLPDRTVDVLLSMTLPRVVVLGGFLSDEECDGLVALAASRLARSETVVGDTGGSEVNSARTSEGMFFERGETELCERIEARIAALVGWPVSHGEGLQVLRYQPGAQYLPHHDYFDPSQPGATSILARGGQRLATLVMYLNTPEAGGATTFPDVGLEVAPIKGNAVFFSYPRPDAATRTLHGGAPVQAGEKWVATKWLRQREFR
ncbi:2-oxoglutarate-dependent dioxygenase [Ideonella dechloratans]|uniref:2-oxoglutarate-dependent dioxygenase n=1 Tax=Ideonella dechloratans TaxID=36863 RepID=A0A643F7P5_IDEDE|nr:2OG-Fe(II) oxygenase [Ideonella dechloratans]KAB0576300.1 2-oxoglutarate-dependent dioxygenase [Ideonella dechloratans]UFU09152.1 2OG-Fe(II) oxygenase [Ideonella dechloratans]